MNIKIKLLLSLSLLSISFLAYANAGIQYGLINTSASTIPNPIKVTGGDVEYYFIGNGGPGPIPAHCPTGYDGAAKVALNTLTSMPLPMYTGTTSRFTFTIDPSMEDCFTNGMAVINLNITQVDGINKPDGICQASTNLREYNYMYTNMNIDETTGTIPSFYCNIVMSPAKK